MTAQEARQIAEQFNSKEPILQKILGQAKIGRNRVYINGPVPDGVIKELTELNYTVRPNEDFVIISW